MQLSKDKSTYYYADCMFDNPAASDDRIGLAVGHVLGQVAGAHTS